METYLSFFPELNTKRLLLRQLKLADAQVIYSFHTDTSNRKYVDRQPPTNVGESEKFIQKINLGIKENKSFYWAICLKNTGVMIGTICLWNFSQNKKVAEIGYELGKEYQGNVYMSEAINIVINYAFDQLDLNAIEAYTHIENKPSIKLLEKSRFKKIKEIDEKYERKEGAFRMEVYELKN